MAEPLYTLEAGIVSDSDTYTIEIGLDALNQYKTYVAVNEAMAAATRAELAASNAESASTTAGQAATASEGSSQTANTTAQEALDAANQAQADVDSIGTSTGATLTAYDIRIAELRDDHTTLVNNYTAAFSGFSTEFDIAVSAKDAALVAQAAAELAETNASVSASTANDEAFAAAGYAEVAQASETAAGSSASAATAAVTQAQTYAAEGEASAIAAANSTSAASVSETNAGVSATAAINAKIAAETAKSAAEISQTNAATSETNADGSASAAAVSATSALASLTTAKALAGIYDFSDGLDIWNINVSDTEELLLDPEYSGGRALAFDPDGNFRYEGALTPIDKSRVYRVSSRVKNIGTVDADKLNIGVWDADENGSFLGGGNGRNYCVIQNGTIPADGQWYEFEGNITGEGTGENAFDPTAAFTAPHALIFSTDPANSRVVFDYLKIEDVTDIEAEASIRQSAIADINNGLSSMLAFRAKAGTADAELELIAASDPTGTVSIARISADDIILNGSVSMKHLIIADFSNIQVDNRIQDESLWNTGSNWNIQTGGSYENYVQILAINETATGTPNGHFDSAYSPPSPVLPGNIYKFSGDFRSNFTDMKGEAMLWARFYDRNDVNISTSIIRNDFQVGGDVNPQHGYALIEAPTDAVFARIQMRRAFDSSGEVQGPVKFFNLAIRSAVDATVITPNSITTELLVADAVTVDKMIIDGQLTLNEKTAGFALGKNSAYDLGSDGMYIGRTAEADNSTGFGLLASKEKDDGTIQTLEITTQNGLRLTNANFLRDLEIQASPTSYTTTQTIDLPGTATSVSFAGVGGGAGGANGAGTASSSGVQTKVEILDGAVVEETYILPPGLGGGGNAFTYDGRIYGRPSFYGVGGNPGTPSTSYYTGGEDGVYVTTPPTAGIAATNKGAGGGGGGSLYGGIAGIGGNAAPYTAFTDIDVSTYTTPKVRITIGTGGAGAPASAGHAAGGAGAPGQVDLRVNETSPIQADVIPLTPTAVGTISKTSASITFPDLGAGVWFLCRANAGHIDIGFIETSPGNSAYIKYGSSATFVSSQTPVYLNSGANGTYNVDYQFFKMGD